MKGDSLLSKFGVPCSIFDIQFMKRVFTALIRVYQMVVSPWLPKSCRFYPTCSDYAIEAFNKYGMMRGLWLSLKRICRCHPWNPGGVDSVPGNRGRKTEVRNRLEWFQRIKRFERKIYEKK